MELYEYIGSKIRELRQAYGGGRGLSQDALAQELDTTANTVSRWETAAYKPSIDDLHKMATFFGVSIAVFFPDMLNSGLQALLSATGDLRDEELKELAEYALFRKARRALEEAKRKPKTK